jgi:hypothetical protein
VKTPRKKRAKTGQSAPVHFPKTFKELAIWLDDQSHEAAVAAVGPEGIAVARAMVHKASKDYEENQRKFRLG